MPTPHPPRQFQVDGTILISGASWQVLMLWLTTDLPPGPADPAVVAEQVRRHEATAYGDPAARWLTVTVTELPPPDARFDSGIDP